MTQSYKFRTNCSIPVLIVLGLTISQTFAGSDISASGAACGTQQIFEERVRAMGANSASSVGTCRPAGDCDIPSVRDGYLVNPRTDIIRLFVQVVCLDDGTNPAASAQDVAVQIDSLNSDFAPYGFRFEYDMRFISSSRFRFLSSFADAELMKATFAVDPDQQLNIYVTTNGFCLCSYATYPWDSAALTPHGGIVMTRERFYPQSKAAGSLTHEMGHCLGLYHVQHGVTEVPLCAPCYESKDASNRNLTGDFCEDTDPSPSNFTCGPASGVDQCSGLPWATTDNRNYMGYAPDVCLSEFSPEQTARMHCWSESQLGPIMRSVPPADTLFGPAPFSVSFSGSYQRPVVQWRWDFGDGQSADVQNPVHTYAKAGVFDVRCSVVTDSGTFDRNDLPRVYVTGDTLVVGSGSANSNSSARVDISITNRVPLSKMVIPFSWAGSFGLTFDSVSTAELRTGDLKRSNNGIRFVNLEPANQRLTLLLVPDSARPIPPGSGAVIGLFFHTPSTILQGVNPLRIMSYDTYIPGLATTPGDYFPQVVDGYLKMGCCQGRAGNIDGDPNGEVDVADLTDLLMYLFGGLQQLPCPAAANLDGDPKGQVDISDLSAMINYLYIGFTPPAACQ